MIISRMKRAFKVKWKLFFLVSQVLSFRYTKQTSKNVVDATFKIVIFLHSGRKTVSSVYKQVPHITAPVCVRGLWLPFGRKLIVKQSD